MLLDRQRGFKALTKGPGSAGGRGCQRMLGEEVTPPLCGGVRVAGLPACLGKRSHDPFDGNAEIQSAASEEQ